MKDIKNAPLFKRIVASILDAAFFVLIYLLSVSFIMNPIANATMGLSDNVLLGYQYQTASHLYVLCQVVSVETGEDTIIEVKDYTEKIISGRETAIRSINTRNEVTSTYLLEHVKYYYISYKTGENVEKIFVDSAKEIQKRISQGYYDLENDVSGIKRGFSAGGGGPVIINNNPNVQSGRKSCCF